MNKEDKSAFRTILSNDLHAQLVLLRPFLSIPSLTFWQTFPFLCPPELIPTPSAIRPNTTTSLINVIPSTKSKNCKKYKCDICSRAFSRSNTLVTHKRIHTGEKPFVCNICDRPFRQPGNLTRHKLIHTAVKPYVCEICMKAFNRLSNLQAHQRIHSKANELNHEKCFSDNTEQD